MTYKRFANTRHGGRKHVRAIEIAEFASSLNDAYTTLLKSTSHVRGRAKTEVFRDLQVIERKIISLIYSLEHDFLIAAENETGVKHPPLFGRIGNGFPVVQWAREMEAKRQPAA
jgi:hypothetical protein